MDKYGKALCMAHQKSVSSTSTHNHAQRLPPPPEQSCMVCNETVSNQVYDYSINHFGAPLCMTHQKTVTPQAIRLSNALRDFDVEHRLEQYDGYKHIDIAIESAKLYLELDGSQHAFSTKQMLADDDRDKHSLREGYTTKRISNTWVDQNVEKLAGNIAVLAKKREYELREQEKAHEQEITLTGIMKSVIKTARKLSEKLENFE
jgi:very-short-patch-repair endonuclease